MRRRSLTRGALLSEGAPRRRVAEAVAVAVGGLLLSGCSAHVDGDVVQAGTQSPGAEEPTLFPFDPELSLTLEQHEEVRSCIVTKLGMPIESEEDGDRAWRALVVCAHEFGYEDLYWPDEDAEFREMLRGLTVEGEPSFLEDLSPFS